MGKASKYKIKRYKYEQSQDCNFEAILIGLLGAIIILLGGIAFLIVKY